MKWTDIQLIGITDDIKHLKIPEEIILSLLHFVFTLSTLLIRGHSSYEYWLTLNGQINCTTGKREKHLAMFFF